MAKLILFEGTDGIGKTKAIQEIEKMLIADGFRCLVVEDAGFSDLGMAVRPLIEGRGEILRKETWFDLFLAIRRENIEIVNKVKDDFDFILYDRSTPSTLVYNNIFNEDLEKCYREIQKRLPNGIDFDVIIYLHDTVVNIKERLVKRPKKSPNDSIDETKILESANRYNTVMTFLAEKHMPVYRIKVRDLNTTAKNCLEIIYGVTKTRNLQFTKDISM